MVLLKRINCTKPILFWFDVINTITYMALYKENK
jgi:hypothetical protein